MVNSTQHKISINTAPPKLLTQLPGIGKDTAYRIVSHRKRHGSSTHWDELAEVREFPVDPIDEIKRRATLKCPPGEDSLAPRRIKPAGAAGACCPRAGWGCAARCLSG